MLKFCLLVPTCGLQWFLNDSRCVLQWNMVITCLVPFTNISPQKTRPVLIYARVVTLTSYNRWNMCNKLMQLCCAYEIMKFRWFFGSWLCYFYYCSHTVLYPLTVQSSNNYIIYLNCEDLETTINVSFMKYNSFKDHLSVRQSLYSLSFEGGPTPHYSYLVYLKFLLA